MSAEKTNVISISKKEVRQLIVGFPRKIVRMEINNVIVELRNVPETEAKNIKTLKPSEVEEVKKRFK